ncbi:hypothetical protein HYS10_02210 [Candidatus Collierbacteria bacterium]|nr:hypothetical protein [Candidatus Collierbacteria bacterium]
MNWGKCVQNFVFLARDRIILMIFSGIFGVDKMWKTCKTTVNESFDWFDYTHHKSAQDEYEYSSSLDECLRRVGGVAFDGNIQVVG